MDHINVTRVIVSPRSVHAARIDVVESDGLEEIEKLSNFGANEK
jgi:hypothetical protein